MSCLNEPIWVMNQINLQNFLKPVHKNERPERSNLIKRNEPKWTLSNSDSNQKWNYFYKTDVNTISDESS